MKWWPGCRKPHRRRWRRRSARPNRHLSPGHKPQSSPDNRPCSDFNSSSKITWWGTGVCGVCIMVSTVRASHSLQLVVPTNICPFILCWGLTVEQVSATGVVCILVLLVEKFVSYRVSVLKFVNSKALHCLCAAQTLGWPVYGSMVCWTLLNCLFCRNDLQLT